MKGALDQNLVRPKEMVSVQIKLNHGSLCLLFLDCLDIRTNYRKLRQACPAIIKLQVIFKRVSLIDSMPTLRCTAVYKPINIKYQEIGHRCTLTKFQCETRTNQIKCIQCNKIMKDHFLYSLLFTEFQVSSSLLSAALPLRMVAQFGCVKDTGQSTVADVLIQANVMKCCFETYHLCIFVMEYFHTVILLL